MIRFFAGHPTAANILMVAIVLMLVFQPDFGQAALILFGWGVMWFVGGAPMVLLLALAGLVVLGGTGRRQTRQAPLTPHTWHDHGRPAPTGCDAMGHDDQPAICATPSPAWGRHDAAMVAARHPKRTLSATGVMGIGGRSC